MPKPATHLLTQVESGDSSALDELVNIVYDELRAIARSVFRRQPVAQSLRPTELVHEAYLRLVDHEAAGWKGRAHFMATAARAMRHILIDHHRRRSAAKRGGKQKPITLSAVVLEARHEQVDLVALDEALSLLADLDERQSQIVEMRIFGGLEINEIAGALDISRRTVQYEWRYARAWLKKTLGE